MRRRTSWGGAALAVLLAACGAGDVGQAEGDPTSTSPPAVEHVALVPAVFPTDVDAALELFGELPDEIAGLPRMPHQTDGEVRYGADGQLFLTVMEASDMGVRDETNAELLSIEARRDGRTVIAQETDPTAPLLYVAGREGRPPLHFLIWTGPDEPLVYAAGAGSAEDLAAVLRAFADAAS